jgi:hypothetical protein
LAGPHIRRGRRTIHGRGRIKSGIRIVVRGVIRPIVGRVIRRVIRWGVIRCRGENRQSDPNAETDTSLG